MDLNLQTNQLLATGANLPLVLTPSGTGAIQAQPADATIANGNARGANAVDWQTVRAAAASVASGTNATICGGNGNTANATNATVGGGTFCSATALNATTAGGNTNTANGIGSWCPGGQHSTSRAVAGRGAFAATRIAALGDAQCGEHPLLRQTTNATPTRLTSDNNTESATNTINLPNFGAYGGRLLLAAKAVGSTDSAYWDVILQAARGANAAATVVSAATAGIVARAPTDSIGGGSAWRLDVAADTTNGGIAITVTGAAATTINWSARFSNVEVATAS